ncbi:MAG: DNA mismatch repair endonuclease MutL, partial [Lachnospiraceae bacterium]|nr:DNA mismatch repair endonuclease MutL [Lachnospiraceae bacterium]
MNRIRVLDRATIDKIAAGEVVESPASVVKELVENAIDAGSTRITVELKGGGTEMIRVTDNGEGIGGDDIRTAFLPHATSKIKDADDLMALSSLGFRGEALSSICAVSRVELITRKDDDLTAWRYVIEGGEEKDLEEIGAPGGTTIIVRDIFFNTPARAKFLKSPSTEGARAGAYVEQLVMSNPGIAFTFILNGRQKITSPGSGKLSDAIYGIYGKDVFHGLIPVSYKARDDSGDGGSMTIGGMI